MFFRTILPVSICYVVNVIPTTLELRGEPCLRHLREMAVAASFPT